MVERPTKQLDDDLYLEIIDDPEDQDQNKVCYEFNADTFLLRLHYITSGLLTTYAARISLQRRPASHTQSVSQ